MNKDWLDRKFLNKEFDKYLEKPFIFVDFLIFTILLLPFIVHFSQNVLKVFHFLDVSIWILIMMEVSFKLLIVDSRLKYLKKNWEDMIVVILPILPNFKIIKEFKVIRELKATKGLNLIRASAFLKRIYRRLENVLLTGAKSVHLYL